MGVACEPYNLDFRGLVYEWVRLGLMRRVVIGDAWVVLYCVET